MVSATGGRLSIVHHLSTDLESFSELDGSPLALLGAALTPLEPVLSVLAEGAVPGRVTVVTGPAALRPAILRRATSGLLFAADAAGSGALLARIRRLIADEPAAPAALIARLGRLTGVAVIVDDADLRDPDCRTFIENLSHRMTAESVIAIFARRRADRTLSLGRPYRRLGLRPLPAGAVAELFRGYSRPDDLAASIGGNATLVEAALDDLGAEFGRAVHQVICPRLAPIAQAVAVLGEHGDPFVLSRVLGMSLSQVGELFDELLAIDLLTPGNTLRTRVRAAVLAGLAPDVRRRLNLRAAEVLYEDAAPAAVVARHLLAGGVAAEAWAAGVLSEAAGQAARERRFDDAGALLGLALDWSVTPDARAELRARLLDVCWWSDPDLAAGLLDALAAGARDGRLAPPRIARLSALMAWQARADDARELLVLAAGSAAGERWIRHVFPVPGPGAAEPDPVDMLRRVVPGETGLEAAQIAVVTLLGLERFDPGASWYARFAREVAASGLPPWRSLLAAAQAATALGGGDPARAAVLARQSIGALGAGRWSVLTALPRAVLLMALTELGRHAEAGAAFTVPPPPGLTRSPYGLLHLRARGRHHLATGAPQAAADDFRAVGDALTSWGIEWPGLLPWRADLAEAMLRLGDRETARRLAAGHLAGPVVPGSPSHTRAVRLLAGTRLSAAEGKVARLASRGYTNREISGLLFITRSTVEQHLTRIYRKLEINRRDELIRLGEEQL